MHVMLFEPRYKGHHLFYIELLVPPLLALGCKVTLAGCPEVFASKEYQCKFQGLEGQFETWSGSQRAEGNNRPLSVYLNCFKAAVKALHPNHAFIPTADGIVQHFGAARLLGKLHVGRELEIDANLLRCRFSLSDLPMKDRLKLWGVRRLIAAAPIRRLFTIDALALERLQKSHAHLGMRLRLMPDPLDSIPNPSQSDARRMLGLSQDAKYLSIVGVMDGRKGIPQLLNGFIRARLDPNCKILLAGRQDPDIEVLVHTKFQNLVTSGQLVMINRLLSDEEVVAAVSATDVVAAPYIGHVGPSAMVMRAIALRKPVLASNYGWVAEVVRRLAVGRSCDVENPEACADAIRSAFTARIDSASDILSEQIKAYCSPVNFVRVWLQRIRQRMELPTEAIVESTWLTPTDHFVSDSKAG